MDTSSLDRLLDLHANPHTISAGAMCARAVIVFFATLILLRLAGARAFGGNTAFDVVLKIMLGAVLSRAVVAASPFWGTLAAGAVFVALHRLLGLAAYYSDFIGKFIKGEPTLLAHQGQILSESLRKNNLSDKDFHEGLRDAANLDSVAKTQAVYLERNGSISVVKKAEAQLD